MVGVLATLVLEASCRLLGRRRPFLDPFAPSLPIETRTLAKPRHWEFAKMPNFEPAVRIFVDLLYFAASHTTFIINVSPVIDSAAFIPGTATHAARYV